MKEMILDRKIYDKCNEAIVLSGCARSGTTIMGKIIHSFQDVEYCFEPPMLFSIFALLPVLGEKEWRLLYETYLYEEFLINTLAGRGLNCNRADDSSIYPVKTEEIIERRLSTSLRKIDTEIKAQNSKIAYKTTDIVPFIPQLQRYYPGIKIIVMTRNAPEVFNSILEKSWFNSRTLQQENLIWPNRFIKNFRIPFWVDLNDDELWYEMDELHRIAYYYLRINKSINNISGCIIVKYDDLIQDPTATATSLAEMLGLSWGDKTEQILGTVRRTKKKRNYDILNHLVHEIRDQVEYYSSIS